MEKNIYYFGDLFQRLKGSVLLECKRLYHDSDISDKKIINDAEEDGITYLVFFKNGNKTIIEFKPHTEIFSLDYSLVSQSEMKIDLMGITSKEWIKPVINKKIESFSLIYGEYLETPYGLSLKFENGSMLNLLYMSETKVDFDALVLRLEK
jgi:hypothetical protein